MWDDMIYNKGHRPISDRQVGGKAFHLFEISEYVDVPAFVAIDTKCFGDLLKLEENRKIYQDLTLALTQKLGLITKIPKLQQSIAKMYLPDEFIHSVKHKMHKANVQFPVAVRSSSVLEDRKEKSGAGMYESYLNISEDQLEEYIKLCYASAFNIKIITNMDNQKIEINDLTQMGIVIQDYVLADLTGIMFSKDPVIQENGCLIEYNTGNSPELMAGGDSLHSEVLGFWDEHIEYKKMDGWKRELLFYAYTIVEKLGYEVDIEWVKVEDQIRIIQCRPVSVIQPEVESEWICSIDEIETKPVNELGALQSWVSRLQIKKIGFHQLCHRLNIPILGWYFIRYGRETDLSSQIQALINSCGRGYYAIMVNDLLRDIQCTDEKIEEKLKYLLQMTGNSRLTVSIRYIPFNQVSVISKYQHTENTTYIEAVPGVMKGLKAGYLEPTVYITDGEGNCSLITKPVYKDYCTINLETDTFFWKPMNSMLDDLHKYAVQIGDYTNTLFRSGINGAVEWWICDGKLWVTDYSKQKKDSSISKRKTRNYVCEGKIEGRAIMISRGIIDQLDEISYGVAISVDHFDKNVSSISIIEHLINRMKEAKKKYGKIVLCMETPCLGCLPLLKYADGVVFKRASILCHLSIYIREKRIPALIYGEQYDGIEEGMELCVEAN